MKKTIQLFFICLCVILLLAPTAKVIIPQIRFFIKYNYDYIDDFSKLEYLNEPIYKLGNYIKDHTMEGEKFLVFRVGDFAYYFNRFLVSYLDPSNIDIYNSKDAREVFLKLKELGINYIYVPSYLDSVIYETPLIKIISDINYAKLKVNVAGYKLFELREKPRSFEMKSTQVAAELSAFYNYTPSTYPADNLKLSNELGGLAYVKSSIRENGVFIGQNVLKRAGGNLFKIDSQGEYDIEVGLYGSGFISIEVIEYDADGKVIGPKSRPSLRVNELMYQALVELKKMVSNMHNRVISIVPDYRKILLKYINNVPVDSENRDLVHINMDFRDVIKNSLISYYINDMNGAIKSLYNPSMNTEYINVVVTNIGSYGSMKVKHIKLNEYNTEG